MRPQRRSAQPLRRGRRIAAGNGALLRASAQRGAAVSCVASGPARRRRSGMTAAAPAKAVRHSTERRPCDAMCGTAGTGGNGRAAIIRFDQRRKSPADAGESPLAFSLRNRPRGRSRRPAAPSSGLPARKAGRRPRRPAPARGALSARSASLLAPLQRVNRPEKPGSAHSRPAPARPRQARKRSEIRSSRSSNRLCLARPERRRNGLVAEEGLEPPTRGL